MTLDTIVDGKFVFKNTCAKNKQLEMDVDAKEAPDEFFFLHIKFLPFLLTTRLSCASMLQTSCIVFIRQCHKQGLINDDQKERLEKYIMKENSHSGIRKQMITYVPKPFHKNDDCQAAYLQDTVSRVRSSRK